MFPTQYPRGSMPPPSQQWQQQTQDPGAQTAPKASRPKTYIADIREMTASKATEALSTYKITRLQKHHSGSSGKDDDDDDDECAPWDIAKVSEEENLPQREIKKAIKLLNAKGADLQLRKATLSERIQSHIDKATDRRKNEETDRRFDWELVQFEVQEREVLPESSSAEERGGRSKDRDKMKEKKKEKDKTKKKSKGKDRVKESQSKTSSSKTKKRLYERAAVDLYYRRFPKPGQDIIALYEKLKASPGDSARAQSDASPIQQRQQPQQLHQHQQQQYQHDPQHQPMPPFTMQQQSGVPLQYQAAAANGLAQGQQMPPYRTQRGSMPQYESDSPMAAEGQQMPSRAQRARMAQHLSNAVPQGNHHQQAQQQQQQQQQQQTAYKMHGQSTPQHPYNPNAVPQGHDQQQAQQHPQQQMPYRMQGQSTAQNQPAANVGPQGHQQQQMPYREHAHTMPRHQQPANTHSQHQTHNPSAPNYTQPAPTPHAHHPPPPPPPPDPYTQAAQQPPRPQPTTSHIPQPQQQAPKSFYTQPQPPAQAPPAFQQQQKPAQSQRPAHHVPPVPPPIPNQTRPTGTSTYFTPGIKAVPPVPPQHHHHPDAGQGPSHQPPPHFLHRKASGLTQSTASIDDDDDNETIFTDEETDLDSHSQHTFLSSSARVPVTAKPAAAAVAAGERPRTPPPSRPNRPPQEGMRVAPGVPRVAGEYGVAYMPSGQQQQRPPEQGSRQAHTGRRQAAHVSPPRSSSEATDESEFYCYDSETPSRVYYTDDSVEEYASHGRRDDGPRSGAWDHLTAKRESTSSRAMPRGSRYVRPG